MYRSAWEELCAKSDEAIAEMHIKFIKKELRMHVEHAKRKFARIPERKRLSNQVLQNDETPE